MSKNKLGEIHTSQPAPLFPSLSPYFLLLLFIVKLVSLPCPFHVKENLLQKNRLCEKRPKKGASWAFIELPFRFAFTYPSACDRITWRQLATSF